MNSMAIAEQCVNSTRLRLQWIGCNVFGCPLLNLKMEDIVQTLATRDSCGPTGVRLMSTHLLVG